LRTIVFLQLDHIGGINTLLYTISNAGMVIVPVERSPAAVCEAIARHRADLLPTSPTFLNLLLISQEYRRHNLDSLRLITYGTEPMPESTLARLCEAFPRATLQQTYGMTEIGILRSKSRDSSSLWVRVGGEGYETKIVDGRLWVRAQSAMLGYLNAPNPFDADGFLDTGDQVEVDGEWLRILGRSGEVINVGGNKVFPAQVESVLLEMEGVVEAAVRGQQHPFTGQLVTATVRLATAESPRDFRVRMRQHCQARLPVYAVPAKVLLSDDRLYNERFKRVR
jgi:acyl-coenzyme A synthetase/AMP-(fatty) acid ligase